MKNRLHLPNPGPELQLPLTLSDDVDVRVAIGTLKPHMTFTSDDLLPARGGERSSDPKGTGYSRFD